MPPIASNHPFSFSYLLEFVMTLMNRFRLFLRSKRGVTAIEYGILAAGVAIVIGALVSSDGPLANAINELFRNIVDHLPTQGGK